MIRALIICLFICFSCLHSQESFQDRIVKSSPGDYIVTEQSSNYTILIVREIDNAALILEEITAPVKAVDPSKITWKEWVSAHAPGHTSWTTCMIDLTTHRLRGVYSYSSKEWLYPEESAHFLSQLLALPLSPVPDREKKRIGPSPAQGEKDVRSLWLPPMVVEGQKVVKPRFDVLKTYWPKDESLLSGCKIEVYFAADKNLPSLPFWMEIRSTHYAFKIRTIDSGKQLVSPIKNTPHKASYQQFSNKSEQSFKKE
jgi:hypothetical protein